MASQDCSQARFLEIMRTMNSDCFDQKTKQQLQDIKQFLQQTRLFKQLLDEVTFQDILDEAAQKLKYAKYDYGQFLFHYGERGDNMYFVLSGSCSVYIPKDEQELAKDIRQLEGIKENESSLPSLAKRSKLRKLEAKQYGEQEESVQNRNDNISILALNEKHLTRYFTSSTKLASYKHVRDLKYLDYFGDLAAGEHFHRRMASIIASSKEEPFEVAFLSLKEYQTIFKSVLERIYKVQFSLLNLFMECPRKLVIDFSFLFNQSIIFDRGQTILTESQALNYIYIIKRGAVSIKKLSSTSNQQLMIALLPPKEMLGYENIFNKQDKHITCNFSAVSEQARTELSFALLSDVLMFLRCYPLLEEVLKKKSQQKMQFYLSRIDKTEKITSNPETMQFLKETKSPKLLEEEDQQAVFSKFLKYSKNSEGDIVQAHSGSSSPKKEKNEDKDESFTDFSQISMQNVQRDNRIIENYKVPKGKSNLALNRAQSLINLKQLQINQPQTTSIEEIKEDYSGIQEDCSQNFQSQTGDQASSEDKLGSSSPQVNQNSFATFSLNCEHSPIFKKNEIFSSPKMNPITLINIQIDQNQKSPDNFSSAYENQDYSQNERSPTASPKRSFQRQGLIMSQKLKGAIQGISAVQPSNWTVKEIEETVQANAEQIKQSDTKEIKLQYLHGEMDSFENAKRFVILKRSTKKQDYLAITSPKSSSLSTTFKVLKKQYSTEKFSNLVKNDQSHNYSQCSPSDSPVQISSLKTTFQRHIASSETSSPIQSPTKKSNSQKYFDFNFSPLKKASKPPFILPEMNPNKETQGFVQNNSPYLPQNSIINQAIPSVLPQLSNETTQLQDLPRISSPLSPILSQTIKNVDNPEQDFKSNQDASNKLIQDTLNKNLITPNEVEPENQDKQKIQLKNIRRHHLFQLSNPPIPTQKQRNLNKFKDLSYSPSKLQSNPNYSFQNPLKKNEELSQVENITYNQEKSKLKIGGITLYSTIPKEASQAAVNSFPIKQETGWLNSQVKQQQASNARCSFQTATPTDTEQQGFQSKRHSSLQKLTSETSPSYQQNIKFALEREEKNTQTFHRKNNSFASFSFNYQEVKATKPYGNVTASIISNSSLKNKREVKKSIQNENQTELESKSNSAINKLTDNSSNNTFSTFLCSIPSSSSFSSQFNLSPSKLSCTPQISNMYSNLSKLTSMPSPSEISLSASPKNQQRKVIPTNNTISQNQELKTFFNTGFLEIHQNNMIKPSNMYK